MGKGKDVPPSFMILILCHWLELCHLATPGSRDYMAFISSIMNAAEIRSLLLEKGK